MLPQQYVPLALQAATLRCMLNLASSAQQGSTAYKDKVYANYVPLEASVQAVHHFVLLVLWATFLVRELRPANPVQNDGYSLHTRPAPTNMGRPV